MSGYFSCQPETVCFHSVRSGWASLPPRSRTALINSSITRRQSPTIGTSARPHFAELGGVDVDVEDLRVGRKGRTLPVTRSSNREPSAINRSTSASR